MEFLLYLLVGAFTGVLAGLFGIGGGLIMVPVLIFSLAAQGVETTILTHMALATSFAVIVFTSLSSVHAHHQKGAVLWPLVRWLSLGIVMGTVLGSLVVVAVPGDILNKILGVFALSMAIKMYFELNPPSLGQTPSRQGLAGAGTLIGFGSAWFGIGGGSFSVPYLTWINVPMRQAVATSAACGLPIALSGALTNMVIAWDYSNLPPWSTGFLYWPAILGLALTSVPMAKVGVQLAHKLDPAALKKLFALLLAILGLYFLFF